MESYFELLTGSPGLPAKSFDPLMELKRLRRGLALRIQNSERTQKTDLPSLREESDAKTAPVPEAASVEAVVKQVGNIKTTLTIWQRARNRTRSQHGNVFRGHRRLWSKKRIPSTVIQYLNTSQEGILDVVNAGLTALGVVAVVFGTLSFWHGGESDLSLGSLVCASGIAVVAIGLGGHFFASQSDFS